ncbi:MAG: ATP-dependent RecD-like DNA helicase [Oscillospiraceae bacterium]
MQKEQEYLRGTVETITFENAENGFAVLTLADEEGELISAVGPLAGSVPGEEITLLGHYTNHSSYGRQFEAEACTYRLPESEGAILKYLSSGALPGIGPAIARRILQKFGDQALEILATKPERMAEVQGLTLARAREAGRRFLELFGIREAIASLSRLGLNAAEALAAYRQYGANTLEAIGQNPYLLCGYPFYMPFGRADALAEKLSFMPESAERVRAALLYTLRHNLQNGHTCLPLGKLLSTAQGFFKIEEEILVQQLEALCEAGEVQQVEYGGVYVYLADALRAEMGAALCIKQLVALPAGQQDNVKKRISLREAAEGIQYAPRQKKAIEEAMTRRILVITGGPGTGKTTTVNAIIALLEQEAERVLLAAPTGRAAKRLAELTGRKAATIHRMLEVSFSPGAERPRFGRNAENPLKCDVLVVDEMSMVDTMLFENMLAALKPNCRLILVGDADQLPSVGPGNVLKGIIESGAVPVVALTEIFRQAAQSLIVSNAHRIVEGKMPQKGGKEDDYFFLRAYGTECRKLVCQLASERLPATYGFSPFSDIQVLCPGRKGPLGTEELNLRLQELLNPPEAGKPELKWGGQVFRQGDKVMQVRNNYDIPYTRTDGEPGAGAFNGDIGFVEEIGVSSGGLTVFCEDRHVYYSQETLHELELAYAITIHKSQGSEFEAVIIPLAEAPPKLRYRNLLYTGVTRARRLCVLAGDEEILGQMVHNGRKNVRYSCFADFLRDEELV